MALHKPDPGWPGLIERCLCGVADSMSVAAAQGRAVPGFDCASVSEPLGRYLDLVMQWNARVDLTAARDALELVDLFVADAAMLALTLDGTPDCVDVGTGAGAPGLPLKLLCPRVSMELVEPKSKRVTFLRTCVSSLGMERVEVRRAGVDQVRDRGFDLALSRATFSPQIWLAEGARISRGAVWVLLAQGEAPALPGWQVDLDVGYEWPLTRVSRRALRFVRAE
jgi:16S rRNA (guanine527-N7)-methyltransferase